MKLVRAAIWAAAALAMSAGAVAQTTRGTNDAFSFTIVGDSNRLNLTIKHWSSEAERTALLAALHDGGSKGLAEALSRSNDTGYLSWPDGLEYIVRYAYRVPVAGGEDVIIALDRPLDLWWDKSAAPAPANAPSIIQLHLSADGRGEGKVSNVANVTAGKDAIVLRSDAALPALLTQVQRERASNG